MTTPTPMRTRLRRGIFVVPTSFTVLNVFFGFAAILFSIRATQANALGDTIEAARLFRLACWSIGVAAICDTLDGLVARMMNATSEFGKEYDSLADVVTFGVAPAVLVYSWGLHLLGRLGGGIAFFFLMAGSLRLARFNIQTGKTDHRYFVGLPIPAGALTLATIINYAPDPVTDERFAWVMLLVTAFTAFAMVSTIRYRSQKYANLQKRRSASVLIVLALLLVVLYRWPAEAFFIFFVSYLVSGPLVKLWNIAFPTSRDGSDPEQPHAMIPGDEPREEPAG